MNPGQRKKLRAKSDRLLANSSASGSGAGTGGGAGGRTRGKLLSTTTAVATAGLAAGAGEDALGFWTGGEECEVFISQVTTPPRFCFREADPAHGIWAGGKRCRQSCEAATSGFSESVLEQPRWGGSTSATARSAKLLGGGHRAEDRVAPAWSRLDARGVHTSGQWGPTTALQQHRSSDGTVRQFHGNQRCADRVRVLPLRDDH